MLFSLLSSRSFPIVVVACFSFILVQKLIDNQRSQTHTKPRLHIPPEAYEKSRNIKPPLALTISALSLNIFLRLLPGFFEVLNILKTDFNGNNSRISGKGVFRGNISPETPNYPAISNSTNTKMVTSLIQVRDDALHKYSNELSKLTEISKQNLLKLYASRKGQINHFTLIPEGLILENNQQKILLTNQSLLNEAPRWPIIDTQGPQKTNSLETNPSNHFNRKSFYSIGRSIWALLGPASQIKVEYCERGLQAGASLVVYGFGKAGFNTNWTQLSDVEYITTSLGNMKRFVRTKLAQRGLLLAGTFGILLLSVRYFFIKRQRNDFRLALKRAAKGIQQNQDPIEMTNDANTHEEIKKKHCVKYSRDQVEKLFRCRCEKYMRNIFSLPCGHLASCYHCITSSEIKKCDVCSREIEDYSVVSFL